MSGKFEKKKSIVSILVYQMALFRLTNISGSIVLKPFIPKEPYYTCLHLFSSRPPSMDLIWTTEIELTLI
jgi:hypothetical protein